MPGPVDASLLPLDDPLVLLSIPLSSPPPTPVSSPVPPSSPPLLLEPLLELLEEVEPPLDEPEELVELVDPLVEPELPDELEPDEVFDSGGVLELQPTPQRIKYDRAVHGAQRRKVDIVICPFRGVRGLCERGVDTSIAISRLAAIEQRGPTILDAVAFMNNQ
jgi:hypothetical protein